MDIFVCLDTLLHDLVDVVDVFSHVLPHVGIQGVLVLLELALFFIQKHACLLQVLVEVQTDLVFEAFLEKEHVVFHHA